MGIKHKLKSNSFTCQFLSSVSSITLIFYQKDCWFGSRSLQLILGQSMEFGNAILWFGTHIWSKYPLVELLTVPLNRKYHMVGQHSLFEFTGPQLNLEYLIVKLTSQVCWWIPIKGFAFAKDKVTSHRIYQLSQVIIYHILYLAFTLENNYLLTYPSFLL